MSEWNGDIETAPRGTLILAYVPYYEEPMVGLVIFPKSKRLTRKDGCYNFKAQDHRGTTYIATHWMPLPENPT